jgi:hypothetical protein
MRGIYLFCGLILALLGVGCATTPKAPEQAPLGQRWYLDPATEMASYRTYGFLQVTAVRYEDPLDDKKYKKKNPLDNPPKRPQVQHTDELIWRVLADQMQAKGYAQVDPAQADIWVVYYGGPRPIAAMSQLRIKPHPFDEYFCQHELQKDSFFVDVIDAKLGTLIYRGWDNGTFTPQLPDPEKVIQTTQDLISFFPTSRLR